MSRFSKLSPAQRRFIEVLAGRRTWSHLFCRISTAEALQRLGLVELQQPYPITGVVVRLTAAGSELAETC